MLIFRNIRMERCGLDPSGYHTNIQPTAVNAVLTTGVL